MIIKVKTTNLQIGKKIVSLFLSVVLLFLAISQTAFAQNATTDEQLSYTASLCSSDDFTDQTLDYVNVYNPTADGRISYTYDDYYRLSSKVYAFDLDTDSSKKFTNTTTYEYKNYSGGNTGIEVDEYSTKVNDGTALSFYYTYDARGNITKILASNIDEMRYVYDDLGQLIREDNNVLGRTYVYTYDDAGNITSKKTYALTAEGATPSSLYDTYGYYYSDSNWGDMLTAYRGMQITYDEVGNPLSYYNGTFYDFTWVQGRRLESVLKGGTTTSYTYNADGIRTSKTTGTLTKEYILNGTQILAELWSDGTTIIYVYDAEGSAVGMLYRNNTYTSGKFDAYFYERNLMGDIIAVYSVDGTKLISYVYDAWGKVTTTYHNGGASTGAQHNPFTYSGYYRDIETGFYYLNSRYYDPAICRFINADIYTCTGQGFSGNNMFVYCGNDPINRIDEVGTGWIKKAAKKIFGTISTSILKHAKADDSKILGFFNFCNNAWADIAGTTTTWNTMIENQKDPSIAKNYDYGLANAGHNGCEIIAIHNAKVALGVNSSFAITARDVQKVGGMFAWGMLGSIPGRIGKALAKSGLKYQSVAVNEMYKQGIYIISYWTDKNSIHTIMIEYDGKKYTPHNYWNKPIPIDTLIPDWVSGYICGYYVYR